MRKLFSLMSVMALVFMVSIGFSEEGPTVTSKRKNRPSVHTRKKALKSSSSAATPTGGAKAGSTGKLPVEATTKTPSKLQAWLDKMKKQISQSQAKQNQLIAVAAVRGSEMAEQPPLYWKGKSPEQQIQLPELSEFDQAINTAINGDAGAAKTQLQAFLTNHPKSPLVSDAQETLDMLNEDTPIKDPGAVTP